MSQDAKNGSGKKIIIVKSCNKENLPKSRPKEQELTTPQIEVLKSIIKEKTKEKGYVVSIYYVYPSGLILELRPQFDGEKLTKNFTGAYKAKLIFPQNYDSSHKYTKDWDESELKNQINQARQKLLLTPVIFGEEVLQEKKGYLSKAQPIYFVPTNFYAVHFDPLREEWIVTFDQEEQTKSERNIFAIFHELAHILYKSFTEELIGISFENLQARTSFGNAYDKYTTQATKLVDQIRDDLEEVDQDLLKNLEEEVKKAKETFKSMPVPEPENTRKNALQRLLSSAQEQSDIISSTIMQSILIKTLVLVERLADAQSAIFIHSLRSTKQGKIDLEFSTDKELRKYYHNTLDSYEKNLQSTGI